VAASGGRGPSLAETEQVQVAVAGEHRRAEELLRRQLQPGDGVEDDGQQAEKISRRVILDQAETLGRQRVGIPGDAVVVVADEQAGGASVDLRRRRFPGAAGSLATPEIQEAG